METILRAWRAQSIVISAINNQGESKMTKLKESFFARDSRDVAKDLLGRKLVRIYGDKKLEGIISETRAFYGKGKRTFGEGIDYGAGKIYIMPFRRGSFLNISTEKRGVDSCVFIYTLIPIGLDAKLTDGPGKLTNTFKVGEEFDGKSINGSELYVTDEKMSYKIHESNGGSAENCVGIYKIDFLEKKLENYIKDVK